MKRSRATFRLSAAGLVAALFALAPSALGAQAGLGHLDDATMVPKGEFRLSAVTAWSRFDSRFVGTGGNKATIPLGADFSIDSLGVTQLPALAGTQNAIQTLTGSPFRLSLGATQAASDARVVVTPLSVEYGVARRLTLGLMLPLVRTRMTVQMRVNPLGTEGNVGINPATVNATALARDSAVVQQIIDASAALQTSLQACQANANASPNCGTLLARQQDATALLQSATQFAATFGAVYGQNADVRGAAVVPVSGSAADALIKARITAFDSSFQAFTSTTPRITATPASAGGVVGFSDLSNLLADPGIAGYDSLKSSVRVAPGDLELSARVLLFNQFADSIPATGPVGLHSRATFTGTYRLPTGQLAAASNPFDIATGRGASSVAGRLALYTQWGSRVGLSATAGYVTSFGKTKTGAFPLAGGAPFPPSTSDAYPYTPGAVTSLQLAPRLMVTHLLGVNAMYDFEHVAANDYGSLPAGAAAPTPTSTLLGITTAPGTLQSVGFGITYSTVSEFDRGKAVLPIDVTFTHLEALSGAARMPKYFRDQIQLRFYMRHGKR
jgi:hypothetical protein